MSDTTTNRTSRARFLGGAAALALAAGALPGRAAAAGAAGAAEPRAYSASHFALELDGSPAALLRGVDGGAVYADVIDEPRGPGRFAGKTIGTPRYEDFELAAPLAPGPLMAWIAAAWRLEHQRRNGSLLEANLDATIVGRRDFLDALVSEVSVPTLDAASKDPGLLSVKLRPELIRSAKPSGKLPTAVSGKAPSWLTGNFRLELDGVDCTKVVKIDGFTVKQSFVSDSTGSSREPAKIPGSLAFPNLKVSIGEPHAAGFADWFDKFVVRGNSTEADEKRGAIVFLATDRATELGRINLHNVGIYKLAPESVESGTESIRRMAAHLYVERMELLVK
jgi:hypothetical protein